MNNILSTGIKLFCKTHLVAVIYRNTLNIHIKNISLPIPFIFSWSPKLVNFDHRSKVNSKNQMFYEFILLTILILPGLFFFFLMFTLISDLCFFRNFVLIFIWCMLYLWGNISFAYWSQLQGIKSEQQFFKIFILHSLVRIAESLILYYILRLKHAFV